ncbi:MAG TPA: alpha/beta fold hydrolase [Thermoanaerobaculia bacterium]|nr:alpha/beta fold hydrolase [Thermoanaerobaculia bacterium]
MLESHVVQLADRTIHFVVSGLDAGPRVLFVHGSPGSWRAFDSYLEDSLLAERARLIAMDRPGFGGSGRGRVEVSLSRQAAAAAAVLEVVGGGPAIVVGHSYGGPVAARLAVDRPELVQALVLVAPSIDPELEELRWFNRAASSALAERLLPRDLVTSNREILPLAAELTTLAPRWGEIRVPVIVVQGLRDRLVDPANADFAERVLTAPPLRVKRLPSVGHLIPWTRPATIKGPLLALLDAARR